eukprot:m.9518 g.9518  ORF g.9518 m.9518 type:complete len:174 (+) comp9436_c0_seq2:1140-1661(+)
MASSTLGWALVDQFAQQSLPAKLLFTTGKMKQDAINRKVSSKAQHQMQGLNEEIKRLEKERNKLKQSLVTYKTQARRDQAELQTERDQLALQCKDLRQELKEEVALRREAEERLGQAKLSSAQQSENQPDMAAACFGALALAVKLQLGSGVAVNIGSQQLYTEALARNVPYEE